MKQHDSLFRISVGMIIGALAAAADPAGATMECPAPPIIMAGANMNTAAMDPKAPIVLALDRAVDMMPFLDPVTGQKTTAPYDFRPFLNSINIAGGRYGLGALLTGMGSSGGTVEWQGAQMIITPDAPLEPGTQYVIWVYKYISVGGTPCPRLGRSLFFKTAGEPPKDGNPIREINLSAIWRGSTNGMQRLNGTITSVHPSLNLVSLNTKELGPLQIILDEGSLLMKGDRMLTKPDLKPGAAVQAEFFGERLTWILVQ
jgi:hypothetical protein